MTVLIAVLAPSLLSYTERSRAQKDVSSMDEVVNAVQLAMANSDCYDEAIKYSCDNNFITYTDSSGRYGQQINDGEYWAPDGSGKATTITFNPEQGSLGQTIYKLENGIVNDMTYGNGSVAQDRVMEGAQIENNQCYLKNMTQLYNLVRQSIGNDVITASSTYKNSSFTIFIKFSQKDSVKVADVSGAFNGTNLTNESQASKGSGTSAYDQSTGNAIQTEQNPGKTNVDFDSSALQGTGSFSGILPDYKTCKHKIWLPSETDDSRHMCNQCSEEGDCEYNAEVTTAATCTTAGTTTYTCKLCGDSYDEEIPAKHTFDRASDTTCNVCNTRFTTYTFIASDYDAKMGTTTATDAVVVIPETFIYNGTKYKVTGIGKYAFQDCTSLTNIDIPDSVANINMYAFRNCTSLTGIDLTGCNNLTSIGNAAFKGCTSLINIILPNNVTKIDYYAFQDCTNLKNITIPDSVTSIGYCAFSDCTSLTSVDLSGCNNLTSIDVSAFSRCSALTTIDIPDSVTSIGTNAFGDCSSLTNVDLPNGITSISAFSGCSALTTINIPDSVTSIGGFSGCSALTTIDIPDGVTSINGHAFRGCSSITNIIIPENVTAIAKCTFEDCTSLKNITLSESITAIDEYAFRNCTSLESITIPDGVKTIGGAAFEGCSSLTSITIPDSVTSIGNLAFQSCDSLTSITIPDSVTSIGGSTFYSCDSLTSVTIGDGVASIGGHAFAYCYSLNSVTIPNSVTSIGGSAFYMSMDLASINFKGTTEQWKSITFGGSWKHGIRNFTVYCTNGTIDKSNA